MLATDQSDDTQGQLFTSSVDQRATTQTNPPFLTDKPVRGRESKRSVRENCYIHRVRLERALIWLQ